MIESPVYLGLGILVVIFYLIRKITTINIDQQEPPLLKPRLPLIGHIIGLMKHEATYFSILR
jgi:hypothetical protein